MLRNEPPLAGSRDELWVGKLIVTVQLYSSVKTSSSR